MTTLKPGEIGILQHMREEFAHLEGEEAIIKRLCQKGERFSINGHSAYAPADGYVLDVRGFGISYANLIQVRRQADPGEVDAIATGLFARLRNPMREAV